MLGLKTTHGNGPALFQGQDQRSIERARAGKSHEIPRSVISETSPAGLPFRIEGYWNAAYPIELEAGRITAA